MEGEHDERQYSAPGRILLHVATRLLPPIAVRLVPECWMSVASPSRTRLAFVERAESVDDGVADVDVDVDGCRRRGAAAGNDQGLTTAAGEPDGTHNVKGGLACVLGVVAGRSRLTTCR